MHRSPLPLIYLIAIGSLLANAAPATPPVDEIVKLSGESLVKTVGSALDDRAPLPFDDSLRILDAMRTLNPTEVREEDLPAIETYAKTFRAACTAGGTEKLDTLVAAFIAGPSSPIYRGMMLFDLTPLWLEREFRALESEKPDPIVPNTSGISLPDAYRRVAKDTRLMCQQFSALVSPHQINFGRGDGRPWISYNENCDVFWRDADSILAGKTKETLTRLGQFEWGGCIGHEELYDPQSLLVFMALVRERRLPEAVGAAVRLPGLKMGENWPQGRQIAIRFLTLCGLDWQEVFCGGLIEASAPFRSLDFGNALAADGGDRVARALAHALLAKGSNEEGIVRTLTHMMRPPRAPDSASDEPESDAPRPRGGEVPPRRAAALTEDTREEIIETFAAWASPEADGYALDAAIPSIASLIRPSTTAALRRALEHHSGGIVHKATEALLARGESVPKSGPVPPITFKVMLGGRLVTSAPVEVALQAEKFSRKLHLQSDGQGNITVPGEDFARRHSPVTAVVFQTDMGFNNKRKLEDPSFHLTFPIRPNQPLPSTIVIPAQPVTLALNLPRLAGVDSNAAVHFQIEGKPKSSADWDTVAVNFDLPPRPQYFIPALQEGVYIFTVNAPGAATWVSESIVIKGFPKTITATLSKGRDARARIQLPKGGFLGPGAIGLVNGKGLEVNQPVFGGEEGEEEVLFFSLSPGIYTLSIRSSAEQRKEMFGDVPESKEILLKPREVTEWKSVTKRFEITESSPDTVDLGTIRVEALPSPTR